MPRRVIAAVLLLVLATLVMPCSLAAQSQQGPHACCAPQLQAHGADCCNSAAPHPAIPQGPDRSAQAILEVSAATLPDFVFLPPANRQFSLQLQPSKRIPATILRT